jgi:hypothetical protein
MIFRSLVLSCALFFIFCGECHAESTPSDVSQKISALIAKIQELGGLEAAQSEAIKSAKIDSTDEVLSELLGRLKLTNNRNTEGYLEKIFLSLGDSANTYLANALRAEENPRIKASIIRVICRFQSALSVRVLVEQFADKRDAEVKTPLMEGRPHRVCDVAYNHATLYIEHIANCKFEFSNTTMKFSERDKLIADFVEFWRVEGDGLSVKLK